MIWKFENLWDGTQWRSPAIIEIDKEGLIRPLSHTHIDEEVEEVSGWAVPGFVNAHSHAFQFAMAGLTEYRAGHRDDFWSWRRKMYQLALCLTPHQMEHIATRLYISLLKQGYTWVVEFHYLHHDTKGQPYQNPAEMSQALLHAAHKTGMGITLIPIFYNQGGFNKDPLPSQKRFISKSIDDYLKLHLLTTAQCRGPRQKQGLGIHSLRAIKSKHIKPLVEEAPSLPWHIHIAEQKKEVLESLEILGQRPVQWLLNHIPVDDNWHLVHATHIDSMEIKALHKQNAHVVLCPSTEGNLGDGFFPLTKYRGHWSIGSDSHILLNPLEELRWLDYIQRLRQAQRNVLCRQENKTSGEILFNEALYSGQKAAGRPPRPLEIGQPLDLIVIKPQTTLWKNTSPKHLLSTLIYSTSPSDFIGVITSGQWVVKDGQHALDESSLKDWDKSVSPLRSLSKE